MKTISISRFKATCLAVLEEVRVGGEPVLVTRRGVPVAEVVPPSGTVTGTRSLGAFAGTATIVADIVAPVVDEAAWEALDG